MGESIQKLNCFYSNVQSLLSKKGEIEAHLKSNPRDLLFFSECWLSTDEHFPVHYSIDGFQLPVVCSKARGGTCIYVSNELKYQVVFPPNPIEDSCWIVIETSNRLKRLYACVYRSPNSAPANDVNLLCNINWAIENFTEIVIVGDFNYPCINWNSNSCNGRKGQDFLDTIIDTGLEQLIKDNTRYRQGQSPSLLDLLLVNNIDIVHTSGLLPPFGKSDHLTIEFSLPMQDS